MHEPSITRNIVAIVGEAAQGRRVRCVTLEAGELSGVESKAIAFCFDVLSARTSLKGVSAVSDLPNLGVPRGVLRLS